jgi:hypothetical protein
LKLDIDNKSGKVKLMMFEDGTHKQLWKLVKEFKNIAETYELWAQDNDTRNIYSSFRRCLGGAARDMWDQINIIDDEEERRNELTFENHLWKLTIENIGLDACRKQKEYLKKTLKPE